MFRFLNTPFQESEEIEDENDPSEENIEWCCDWRVHKMQAHPCFKNVYPKASQVSCKGSLTILAAWQHR